MKIKVTPILTKVEDAMWRDIAGRLRNLCNLMKCPSSMNCEGCPFDELTDHAHDLANEIDDKLSECKIEEEGK